MTCAPQIDSEGIGLPSRERTGLTILGRLFLSLICATPILWASRAIAEPEPSSAVQTPTEAMRTTTGQALKLLRDRELKKPERMDELVTRLKKIADARFDYGEMAKRSLGIQLNRLGEKEQQEFVDLFTEFLTATYVEKIHTYSGEEVTFLNERLEGNYAEVKTVMIGKKTDTPMDYRLMMKGGDWKAYDVVVDGISLVQNYRTQFTAILRSSSYDQLVVTLRNKIAQHNVKTSISEASTSSH